MAKGQKIENTHSTLRIDVDEQSTFGGVEKPLNKDLELSLEFINGEQKGEIVTMKYNRLVIGRRDGDLIIKDSSVSAKHAAIEVYTKGKVYVRDLSSTNGTFVNEYRIISKRIINNGSIIRVGRISLKFNIRKIPN